MRDRWLLLIVAAVYAALFAVLLPHPFDHAPLVLFCSATVIFPALLVLLRRVELSGADASRLPAIVIVAVAVALQVIAWTHQQTTSDDVYRYLWDARVQFAGIDPYAHPPASPALAHLRDPALFPPGHCSHHAFAGGCTRINRPTKNTVYPPAAQLAFDAVHLLSGGGRFGTRPFQIAASLGVVAITVLLLLWRRGQARWPAALWAWSPLAVVEFGNNAHIDWLAVLFTIVGLRAAARARPVRSGIWLAFAVLTKLYPALVLPAVLRRRPAVLLAAAVATSVLLYLPHVLAIGTGVVGYLPGYLREEGYASGNRLLLLGAVLPHPADTIVGAVLLAAAAWWTYRRSDPDAPQRAAVDLVGVAFVIVTPSFGWYAGLLLALCAWTRRWEWVPLALAPTLVYLVRTELTGASGPESAIYLGAVLAVAALAVARRRTPHTLLFR